MFQDKRCLGRRGVVMGTHWLEASIHRTRTAQVLRELTRWARCWTGTSDKHPTALKCLLALYTHTATAKHAHYDRILQWCSTARGRGLHEGWYALLWPRAAAPQLPCKKCDPQSWHSRPYTAEKSRACASRRPSTRALPNCIVAIAKSMPAAKLFRALSALPKD